MIAFGIESGRKRKNLGGTEFHAEPACFASFDNNGNASFSHKNPHNGVLRTPVVQKELWFFLSQDGVTQVTEACEAGYRGGNLQERTVRSWICEPTNSF
jgi:hypothetical protein